MWTSIYVATSKEQSDKLRDALEAGGIMTNIRPVGSPMELGENAFEIRVLESEVEEAQEILYGENCGL